MNGVHDMGGMHGMGPVVHERNEPVFHDVWEGRAWGLQRAMGRWGRGRWGNTRYELERIPAAEYLRMSYYERWFTVLVNRLLRSDLITREELETGKPDRSRPAPTLPDPPPRPANAPGDAARLSIRINARFKEGQAVRGRNIHPEGHTRMPRYTRGRRGTVIRDNGVFNLQDTDVDGQSIGPRPQHVYTVRFAARELWGDTASSRDSICVDMWEDYLERS
jgi:nitrile hydratase subunit beta